MFEEGAKVLLNNILLDLVKYESFMSGVQEPITDGYTWSTCQKYSQLDMVKIFRVGENFENQLNISVISTFIQRIDYEY